MFEIRDVDLAGRIGRLKTKSGVIETPYLFPVVDPTLRKQPIEPSKLKDIGFPGIITNAYIFMKTRRGSVEDIHKALNFSGVIMTDSGAYQILQYGEIEVSNRDIVEYQCKIGSDIGVILDIPTRYEDPRERVEYSVRETLRRAYEVLDIVESCKSTLWVLPIQGGVHFDLLRYSAEESCKLDSYAILGLGSPTTLLETFQLNKVVEMVGIVRSIVPPSKPLHLFGAGHPLIIPFVVALGVDLMDSASYVLYARDGRYITRRGTYRLDELSYLPCSCPVCSRYSVEELLELDEETRTKLLAEHNLHVLMEELRWVKQAIKEGRLWEYLEERAHSHPAARRAFEVVKRFLPLIMRYSPKTKPNVYAYEILSTDSLHNPKVLYARMYSQRLEISKSRIVLIPMLHTDKPAKTSSITSIISRSIDLENAELYVYTPFLGVFSIDISDVFPFSQFESKNVFNDVELEDLVYVLYEFIDKNIRKGIASIEIVLCSDIEWNRKVVEMLFEIFSDVRAYVKVYEIKCTSPTYT